MKTQSSSWTHPSHPFYPRVLRTPSKPARFAFLRFGRPRLKVVPAERSATLLDYAGAERRRNELWEKLVYGVLAAAGLVSIYLALL